MIDESLRALERTARERPDDVAAGQILARAFARTGDVRREYLEWSRLARLRDVEARQTVTWWSRQSGLRFRAALPEKLQVVRTRAPADRSAARLVGATRRFLVLAARDAVYLVDPVSLEETAKAPAPDGRIQIVSAPCGDGVLLARGRTLVLHDESGRVVAQTRLPESLYTLELMGDRALVQSWPRTEGHQVFLIDVGEDFGRVLLTRRSDDRHHSWPRFVDRSLLIHEESSASLVDADTGQSRAVPRGLLDAAGDRSLVAEGNVLFEYDGASGGRVWEAQGAHFSADEAFFVGKDLALVRWVARGVRGALAGPLAVYARGNSRAVWSFALPHGGFFYVGDDAVVTVVGRPHLSVKIFDLASGRECARTDVERLTPGWPAPGAFSSATVWTYGVNGVVFAPGAVVALGLDDSESRLVRLE